MVEDPVDVVIVGAGQAGSVYAAVLAEAGRSVLLLESGRGWTLDKLVSSQIWARRLKWGGPPVRFRGDRPGFSHNLNTGSGLGGAALHHYATWPRLHAAAFQSKRLTGRGIDWPFDYDELRPWYDRVQEEVGISGDAAAEIWRPPGAPYPMLPLARFAQARVLERGFAALGLPTAPLPVAITSTAYKGRPPCLYDGWCDAGCPIGALANPLVTWQPRAIAAGAQVKSGASVLRILPATGTRAGGVDYIDASGTRRTRRARLVVLAASVIQNPRLMFNSASPTWPSGPGNDHDQLGRNLMMDGTALVYGLFDEPTEPHLGVSAGQLTNRVRGADDRPGAPPGSYQWQIAPSMKPNDIFGVAATRPDLFGPALEAFIVKATRSIASMVAMIEQLPDPSNRVILSPDRDRYGMPMALVEHRVGAHLEAMWVHCRGEGLRVLEAAGASESWAAPYVSGHLAGGTIAGNDPAQSVADPFGRVHGVSNLILSGAGLFPSTGGVSPTFTVTALALRSASHIRDEWSSYAA